MSFLALTLATVLNMVTTRRNNRNIKYTELRAAGEALWAHSQGASPKIVRITFCALTLSVSFGLATQQSLLP